MSVEVADLDTTAIAVERAKRRAKRQVDAEEQQALSAPCLCPMPAARVIAMPRPLEVVEGIATENNITLLPAESGAGKTFVLLAISAHVCAGVPFFGRQVTRGSVVYLSFEGDDLGSRLRALRDVQGHTLADLYIVRASDPLSPRVTRDEEQPSMGELHARVCLETLAAELAAAGLPPIRLVIGDTVRASMQGDENASDAAAAYLRVWRRLLACVPGAAAILAHHAGWQDGEQQRKRERGSSTWRGNVDITLYLESGKYDAADGTAELTLATLKSRDGEKLPPLRLIRRRVEIGGTDRYGRPDTSCVIERDSRTRADRDEEQAANVAAAMRSMDLQVLQAVVDRPELATSKAGIRTLVGARMSDVGAACDRLVRNGWLQPARRGAPFEATDTGRQARLAGGRL